MGAAPVATPLLVRGLSLAGIHDRGWLQLASADGIVVDRHDLLGEKQGVPARNYAQRRGGCKHRCCGATLRLRLLDSRPLEPAARDRHEHVQQPVSVHRICATADVLGMWVPLGDLSLALCFAAHRGGNCRGPEHVAFSL